MLDTKKLPKPNPQDLTICPLSGLPCRTYLSASKTEPDSCELGQTLDRLIQQAAKNLKDDNRG